MIINWTSIANSVALVTCSFHSLHTHNTLYTFNRMSAILPRYHCMLHFFCLLWAEVQSKQDLNPAVLPQNSLYGVALSIARHILRHFDRAPCASPSQTSPLVAAGVSCVCPGSCPPQARPLGMPARTCTPEITAHGSSLQPYAICIQGSEKHLYAHYISLKVVQCSFICTVFHHDRSRICMHACTSNPCPIALTSSVRVRSPAMASVARNFSQWINAKTVPMPFQGKLVYFHVQKIPKLSSNR